MKTLVRTFFLLLLASFLQLQPAFAQSLTNEPFPGKGDEQAWRQACEVCNQGMQLFQTQRFAEAGKSFEKAMEIYSFDSLFSYGAGLAHQSNAYLQGAPSEKRTELQTAAKFFELSTKLKADRFDCWIHLANVQSELQEYEKSLKSLQTAMAISGISEADRVQTENAISKLKADVQLSAEQQMALMQQPQTWQELHQNSLAPTSFTGYTRFVDPGEHAFEVEVPAGWKTEGGLTRRSAIDVRPWVRVTSPDQLIVAFIGDGSLPAYTMPTALLSKLGFYPGRAYNGSIIKSYVPASKFVPAYVQEKLKSVISNMQIVAQNEHPDFAREVNGSVGATRSECSSIKITGNYKDIPAVGYFIAATKATVMSGTGMWWVTYVAGELGPADRDAAGLSVILHMMQTFHLDPQWQGQSLATTAQVSHNYRQAAQQMSKSISDRYWSQQAFNDRMNQSYWNRQASQDRAANNFSDYIRGQETVSDPQTGNQYKVDYGPRYHWIDPAGNVTGTDLSAPGPEWRQLNPVP